MLHKFSSTCFVIAVMFSSCNISKHSGKSHDAMPGTWQSQPIVIDGDSKDWPSPYPNYDAKAMVAYATSNDKRNLYITMETGDEMTQMKILKQGMAVSIDTNGKKDAQFTISYPLQNDNDPGDMTKASYKVKNDMQAHSLEKKMEQRMNKNAEGANQFSLDGFKDCNGGFMVTQNLPCGIKVIARIDEYKELVWEAVIPFKALYNKDSITEADAGKPISVCFAVKGFKRPESKSTEGNNNSMTANNMRTGGMGGGGGRGGGRGSATNPMEHLYESTKTWKHFGIAYQR
jgi:hypothetical protein